MPKLPQAPSLEWSAQGAPISRSVGDVYFSRDGGLAETGHVFLAGCGLPQAWFGRTRFAICELGFGVGLNALALWRLWRDTSKALPAEAFLDLVSIERTPLDAADAARALAAFPEVADLADRLIKRWPIRAPGVQRVTFPDDRFRITIIHNDAGTALARMSGHFDAWFLDGFAPAKNPDAWSPAIAQAMARLSAPGARVATYTVASAVRHALKDAGFAVEKRPGFGRKRERLEATLTAPPPPKHALLALSSATSPPKSALVIGGGIAGAAMAHALLRRGLMVTLLDAAPSLADGASGNPAGLVMPRLDRGDTGLARLFLAAYIHAVQLYGDAPEGVYDPIGVRQRIDESLAALLADPPLPGDWLTRDGDQALFPQAGLLQPKRTIAWLTGGATIRFGARVEGLEGIDRRWRALSPAGAPLAEAEVAIIATGEALARLDQTRFLPIERSRGQIEWGPATGVEGPAHVDGAYAAPFEEGVLFGATFDKLDAEAPCPPADAASRIRNLKSIAALAPDWRPARHLLESRAAVRAATADRAPIAGLCPDAPAFLMRFAGLRQGRAPDLAEPAPAHAGLFVLGGLGARGLTLAPLLADRLASEICGEPQALDQAALDAIHPARFLVRALKRNQL